MTEINRSMRKLLEKKKFVRVLETHSALAGLIAEKTTVERNGKTR